MQKKQSLGMKPGLSNISALLSQMGDPQEKLRIIHIAGTNGKGTVAALISNALSDCGLKTGLFTSPWVVDYREQIQINGSFIPEDRFAAYVERYAGEPVTEFELLTAIMYQYFADEQVDYAVVECGMGGALDATNAFSRPELAVITEKARRIGPYAPRGVIDLASVPTVFGLIVFQTGNQDYPVARDISHGLVRILRILPHLAVLVKAVFHPYRLRLVCSVVLLSEYHLALLTVIGDIISPYYIVRLQIEGILRPCARSHDHGHSKNRKKASHTPIF